MNGLPAFLDDALIRAFLGELLATPRGRATLLKQIGDAEGGDGGELDIFSHMLEVIDDDEVKKLVRVHKADEERHERLFFNQMKKTGAEPVLLPKDSHLLRRLDAKLGFFSKPVTDRAGVVEAYMLLLVIEERALKQMRHWQAAFIAAGDPETGEVFDQVRKDEERHLRYCEAITKRYSTDENVRQEKLAKYRALEEKCFDEVQAINLRILVNEGFVGHTWWTKIMWGALSSYAEKRIPEDMRGHLHPVAAAA